MIEKNYYFCSHCFEAIKEKGSPSVNLLESIFEVFSIINEPVALQGDSFSNLVLEYLEKNEYILTTEFPDPSDENQDIILVLPLGCFKVQKDATFFCFDTKNHD